MVNGLSFARCRSVEPTDAIAPPYRSRKVELSFHTSVLYSPRRHEPGHRVEFVLAFTPIPTSAPDSASCQQGAFHISEFPHHWCMPTSDGWPTLWEHAVYFFQEFYYDIRFFILRKFFPSYLARRQHWARVRVKLRRLVRRLLRSFDRTSALTCHLYRIHHATHLRYADDRVFVPLYLEVPRYFP